MTLPIFFYVIEYKRKADAFASAEFLYYSFTPPSVTPATMNFERSR